MRREIAIAAREGSGHLDRGGGTRRVGHGGGDRRHPGFALTASLGVSAVPDGLQLGQEVVAVDGATARGTGVPELLEELGQLGVIQLSGEGLARAQVQGQPFADGSS